MWEMLRRGRRAGAGAEGGRQCICLSHSPHASCQTAGRTQEEGGREAGRESERVYIHAAVEVLQHGVQSPLLTNAVHRLRC